MDCPPVMGGIGAWTGQVDKAELEVVATYKQDWWPAQETVRYPFKAITDSQSTVHWAHTTPGEESPLPLPAKH